MRKNQNTWVLEITHTSFGGAWTGGEITTSSHPNRAEAWETLIEYIEFPLNVDPPVDEEERVSYYCALSGEHYDIHPMR